MKKIYTPKILTLLLLLSLATACSMKQVTLSAMRPAEITFPTYVQTLLLVDRTKFNKEAVNILEGVLTGELPGQDRAGLQETMSALQSSLLNSPRFKVKTATEIMVGNSITAALPEPLNWKQIEELCARYGTDAVVAVEVFDTDFIVTDGKRKVKKKVDDANGLKKEIEVEEFYAQGVGNVKIGFRLYDPKARTIVDQQTFSQSHTWQAGGTTVLDAMAHLIAKSEATKYVSRMAGNIYAHKIAPMPTYISREFYAKSKKSEMLNEGARHAEVNNWKQAIESWEYGLSNAQKKEAGRLCYDIAIAHEVLGDLNAAKKWAQRAYAEYGNKKARNYSRLLDYRMAEEEKLKKQLN